MALNPSPVELEVNSAGGYDGGANHADFAYWPSGAEAMVPLLR
jgi:hypothetical protein